MISMKQGGTLLFLAFLLLPSQLRAEQAPFSIDLKELDREKPAVSPEAEKKKTPKTQKSKKTAPVAAAAKSAKTSKVRKTAGDEADYIRYTVKPGDHIFKILVVRLGMSNEAAERLVPEIIRLNNISNIRNLTVGRTLLIPRKDRQERVAKSADQRKSQFKKEEESEAAAMLAAGAKLEAQGATSPGVEAPADLRPPVKPTAPVASEPAIAAPTSAAPAAPAHTASAPSMSAPTPAAPTAAAPAAAAPTTTAPNAKAQSATAPATEAPTGKMPPAPATTASPNFTAAPVVPPVTWICSVKDKEPAKIVDAVMNALSLPWSKNRIIQSDDGAPNSFSIRVDRYFELKGMRYVVSIGVSDPYSYTLIRMLESAGYQVLMINSGDDFKTVSEKLIRFVGLVPNFGKYPLQGGKETTGFLIQQDNAGGWRVVITSEAADPKLKWTMPEGCGKR